MRERRVPPHREGPMKILFIGDIVGRPGRHAVQTFLPELIEDGGVDVVIANAENASGGLGVTPETLEELNRLGIHAFTLGNHTWRKDTIIGDLKRVRTHSPLGAMAVLRPANYPHGVPGRGATILTLPDGRKLGLVSVIGRVYMESFDCPFKRCGEEVDRIRKETPLILVDIHAEATSEKVALGWHFNGKVSAVVGTHTHIQTADEWILPGGTGYISDVGMCGPTHSVIGVMRERVIEKFMTGLPRRFDIAKGPSHFCAVLIEADDGTGQCTRITRILKREETSAG